MTYEEVFKNGLTPQEKINVYEIAKSKFVNNCTEYGICLEIIRQFDNWVWETNEKDSELLNNVFPEFMKTKPKHKEIKDYWFKTNKQRIEVLNKLIEEQKKLI